MATYDIIPNADNEGKIGRDSLAWDSSYFEELNTENIRLYTSGDLSGNLEFYDNEFNFTDNGGTTYNLLEENPVETSIINLSGYINDNTNYLNTISGNYDDLINDNVIRYATTVDTVQGVLDNKALTPSGLFYNEDYIEYKNSPIESIMNYDFQITNQFYYYLIEANETSTFWGLCLAPNGKIYSVPRNSSYIVKIDPETDTFSTFGSLTTTNNKWAGGVSAPNGKLYYIPRDSTTVLKVDPDTDTTSTFGSLAGSDKWAGGVLSTSGYIYGVPFSSSSVLKIDPETDTTSTFGSVGGTVFKWSSGALAPNGKIYCAPFGSSSVLKIDPETDTTSTFGSAPAGTYKYSSVVLAPNGKIYGIPHDATTVLKIDPETDTISTFGSLAGSTKWAGGVLAPNGKIYGIPFDNTYILEIDPETDTTSLIPTTYSDTGKWWGGVLAPNGKIYAISRNDSDYLVMVPVHNNEHRWALSPYYNKM